MYCSKCETQNIDEATGRKLNKKKTLILIITALFIVSAIPVTILLLANSKHFGDLHSVDDAVEIINSDIRDTYFYSAYYQNPEKGVQSELYDEGENSCGLSVEFLGATSKDKLFGLKTKPDSVKISADKKNGYKIQYYEVEYENLSDKEIDEICYAFMKWAYENNASTFIESDGTFNLIKYNGISIAIECDIEHGDCRVCFAIEK